jgi:ribosomal protein S18 acetylase RimI-like enzyme
VSNLLDNPVFNALNSGDAHLGGGNENVKFFDEEVSPFVGFREDYPGGFDELYLLLPEGRKILYATRQRIEQPKGWHLLHEIKGLQFVYTAKENNHPGDNQLVPLNKNNAEEMIELAALTKPGPFNSRTIEFGNYFGIFENGRLAAMTGQRLHVERYTEISAVCTHPNHLGKGFAASLIQQQLYLITKENKVPFLHVREDNSRAIALYERLGFTENGAMNFYFIRRGK